MPQPRWDDAGFKGGTMVRVALWLVQEVGVGQTFTKEDLRRAFPGVAQADRRLRDLRDYGWILATPAQDATLLIEQTRFVKPGVEVWDADARRAANPGKAISARERDRVMSRDDYMCTICGIAGGDEYPEDRTRTAVLSVSRAQEVSVGREVEDALVTVCKRCASGRARSGRLPAQIADDVLALDPSDRDRFRRWAKRGRRDVSDVERVWSQYLRLAPEGQAAALAAVEEH